MAKSLIAFKRVNSAADVPFEVVLNDDDEVEVLIDGVQVLTEQQPAIADLAETGSDEDSEAREAINDILEVLREHGLIATSA